MQHLMHWSVVAKHDSVHSYAHTSAIVIHSNAQIQQEISFYQLILAMSYLRMCCPKYIL